LLEEVADAVSTEARAKYNEAIRHDIHSIYFGLTIWSPNINIFRDPRWGRGQETYGEDPFLTGVLGRNFIEGLQGPDPLHPRSVATPKHFAVHSGPESERHRFDVEPSLHDLYDTYLPQFRMAIVDAHADSIMCAYNAIDGKPACASDLLLNQVLRGDWKFNGFVTSDCDAVGDFWNKTSHHYSPDKEHAAATGILMGTDTDCGGTYLALPAAVHQGLLKESDIDRDLERLFVARFRLGLFDLPSSNAYAQIPFSQDRSPAHLALSEKAARESIVLLKNDGILPLRAVKYKTVAVIGPTAASLAALEGNYNAIPKDPVMPVDALRSALSGAKVLYAQGAPYADGIVLPAPSTLFRPSLDANANGLKAEYFAGDANDIARSFAGTPVATRIDKQIDFDWNVASPVEGVPYDRFAVRWTGFIVPPQPGDFDFKVHASPNEHEWFVAKIDGKEVGHSGTTPSFHLHFADTQPHAIEIDYTHHAPLFGAGFRLDWTPPAGMLQAEAARIAAQADLIVAMVGLSPNLEGEAMNIHLEGFSGGDRTDITLPAPQVKMLEQAAATGKPLVVVLLNGSALAVNWAQQHANAIVEAWYPGEFGGKAIADTLLGLNNPSGRLPVTFYRSVSDLPPFEDYSIKNRTYRYFTGTPLYGFGYGLSYSRFDYSKLHLSTASVRAGQPLTATVELKNTSRVPGEEVAQCYLLPPAEGNGGLSPRVQLVGFQRVSLKPGEARRITLTLTPRELSEVDAQGQRSVQAGKYALAIGGAQPNDQLAPTHAVRADFTIEGSASVAR